MNFEITELSDFSGEMAHIYSVTLRGEEQTLLEQFFDDNAEYEEELATIVEKLLVMGNDTGCRYEFFKHHEGTLADGVAALRVGQIRLYCLYFDRTAVFFGSGGYKSPEIKAYQEDPALNAKAVQMREIAARINKAIIDKDIVIEQDGSITINGTASASTSFVVKNDGHSVGTALNDNYITIDQALQKYLNKVGNDDLYTQKSNKI